MSALQHSLRLCKSDYASVELFDWSNKNYYHVLYFSLDKLLDCCNLLQLTLKEIIVFVSKHNSVRILQCVTWGFVKEIEQVVYTKFDLNANWSWVLIILKYYYKL